MTIRAGETAGRYQVLQLIGRGSFGVVLLAEDPRWPRKYYALKVIPCDHLDSDTSARARESALAEADLLRRLRHPHIVSCYEVCWDAYRFVVWFALDYMDGGDVQTLIAARRAAAKPPVEARFVRMVLAAIGSALGYIHSENVLHRDVKPSNLLLTREAHPQVKLADFGISKLLEATGNARTVVGTPYYMAPEIVCGQPYGPASDAWALGVCIYELASSERPFDASNQLALARQIIDELPRALPAETPADLYQVIFGFLVKDASRRMKPDAAIVLIEDPSVVQEEQLGTDVQSVESVSPSLAEVLASPGSAPAPNMPAAHNHAFEGQCPRHGTFGLVDDDVKKSREKDGKARGGPRLWFRFGKHLRPGRAKGGDPEVTEIAPFSYDEGDDSDEKSGERRERRASPQS